jgi:hypothetical protein
VEYTGIGSEYNSIPNVIFKIIKSYLVTLFYLRYLRYILCSTRVYRNRPRRPVCKACQNECPITEAPVVLDHLETRLDMLTAAVCRRAKQSSSFVLMDSLICRSLEAEIHTADLVLAPILRERTKILPESE